MEEPRWTLDELAERVDAALAVDYPGQSSGRVRAVPDRRAIRWYTTIGLIDRPVAHRGRTALYGPRHLLQLVAVKRLQADGMPLVAIQQELAGATDAQLTRVANLPSARDGAPTGIPRGVAGRARRAEFWRQPPSALTPATVTAAATPDPVARTDAAELAAPAAPVSTLNGVRLGEGAILLLEPGKELDAADLHAILDAAQPLLAVLRDRGLGGTAGRERRRERP
jgi:DNA-binding transcriptional MerR regulator